MAADDRTGVQLRAVEMGISAPGDASRIASSSNPMAADLEAGATNGSNPSKPASEQIVRERAACKLQPIALHLPSFFLVYTVTIAVAFVWCGR